MSLPRDFTMPPPSPITTPENEGGTFEIVPSNSGSGPMSVNYMSALAPSGIGLYDELYNVIQSPFNETVNDEYPSTFLDAIISIEEVHVDIWDFL